MNTITPLQANLAKLTGAQDAKGNPLADLLHAKQNPNEQALMHGKLDQDADFHPSAKGLRAAAATEKYEQAYGYSQTMKLTLRTKEGDTVQVDFRQLYAQYQSYQHDQAATAGPKGARYFESTQAMEATAFQERFGFSVKGNLNQNELKAIYNVFEQVNQLANQFFDGNIEEAFKQAQHMKIDFGQLSNVSLDMQKSEVKTQSYQRAAAYQQVQQSTQGGVPAQKGDGKVADLPPYLQKMQQAVENMSQYFEEARKKVDQLFSMTLAQRDPAQQPVSAWYDKVKSLHDQLAQMAGLDKVTLKPSGVEIPTDGLKPAAENAKGVQKLSEAGQKSPQEIPQSTDKENNG